APTFSACELAAAFLLPFVAIRVVGGDRQSGALKLEAQQPMSPIRRVMAKAIVLLAAWLIALVPAGLAAILWRAYGGRRGDPRPGGLPVRHLPHPRLPIAPPAPAAPPAPHPSPAPPVTPRRPV